MQEALGSDTKVLRLENGAGTDDGLKVRFDIITSDEKSHTFWLADEHLELFVRYVVNLSQYTAGISGKMKAPNEQEKMTVYPIEAVGIAVLPGRVNTEGLLSIHLGTFALTFALSANVLGALHDQLGQGLHPTTGQKPH